ncbi:unnamed protein product, partial [Prorocentrum cordatum]
MAAGCGPNAWRPSEQRANDILALGVSGARRAARARRRAACEAAARAHVPPRCAPGSWRDREAAARPALRLAALGLRVPGGARCRRNAAWHAARAPPGGFAGATSAALAQAAAGPRLAWGVAGVDGVVHHIAEVETAPLDAAARAGAVGEQAIGLGYLPEIPAFPALSAELQGAVGAAEGGEKSGSAKDLNGFFAATAQTFGDMQQDPYEEVRAVGHQGRTLTMPVAEVSTHGAQVELKTVQTIGDEQKDPYEEVGTVGHQGRTLSMPLAEVSTHGAQVELKTVQTIGDEQKDLYEEVGTVGHQGMPLSMPVELKTAQTIGDEQKDPYEEVSTVGHQGMPLSMPVAKVSVIGAQVELEAAQTIGDERQNPFSCDRALPAEGRVLPEAVRARGAFGDAWLALARKGRKDKQLGSCRLRLRGLRARVEARVARRGSAAARCAARIKAVLDQGVALARMIVARAQLRGAASHRSRVRRRRLLDAVTAVDGRKGKG